MLDAIDGLKILRNQNVADVGCGAGAFLFPFFKRGMKCHGIDYSKNSIKICRKFITNGKFVVGEREPYDYLVKSIENFINQEQLIDLMQKNGFERCKYRNLSGGIVSIHSGWKI